MKKREILLLLIIIFAIIMMITSCSNSFENEKFIIVDKSSYSEMYFIIAKIDTIYTHHSAIDSTFDFIVPDTLFTVFSKQNFNIHENLWWDQLYYSKGIGDTIQLEYINKKRFWRKLK